MSERITWSEFLKKYEKYPEPGFSGYLAGALRDKYIFTAVNKGKPEMYALDEKMGEKALELRFFNRTEEIKLFRTSIDQDFFLRHITEENEIEDHMDEIQYLDIDTKKGIDTLGTVRTTGGGAYYLPEGLRANINDLAVWMRSYFGAYPESGHARVTDWRLVDAGTYSELEAEVKNA